MKKIAFLLMIVMAISLFAGCARSADTVTLNVLNWGDYIDEELITRFEDETGIKINYTTLANNEEMLVKLQQEDCIYDLCFPSDYIIEKLIGMDLLHEINKDNIPNLKNIDPRFMDLDFDPDNKYSIPYMWGTVGILYNTTMVDDPVNSWDILWNEKYSGQILMYNSIRDTIGITLMKLGYSINTRNEADIAAAEEALIEQKPLVQAYLGDEIKDRMIGGGAVIPAKTESTMQTSSAQSQKRCLVAFIKYSPHHFSAARAYRAAVVCRQYSTKPACWEREIAFRALVPVRGGRKCANAVVYDCKNIEKMCRREEGGVCSMRARTAAARKRLCWAYRGSKTPLHSVIRQIPQTTVAAGRVLRYNQTNLCLSA